MTTVYMTYTLEAAVFIDEFLYLLHIWDTNQSKKKQKQNDRIEKFRKKGDRVSVSTLYMLITMRIHTKSKYHNRKRVTISKIYQIFLLVSKDLRKTHRDGDCYIYVYTNVLACQGSNVWSVELCQGSKNLVSLNWTWN